ncbi:hypothetical protein [Spirosoma radiotolerans]|uniref:Ig-like domain-containing protein n=1 Tax=Spirosoma radiotolerans TaxID=1379870 RepID=A0A0E3V523_9BACT|nr:hypothetical protein [Spirosoma radiotolerans]AKD53812.1 hypothetical protein SD10_01735 [Spirosoma radiotolerans]
MMGKYTKKHGWTIVLTVVFTISSLLVRAQSSGSFGNTFVHTNEEMGIFVQHNFLNGGSGILPGIVGTERNNPKGFVSFNTGSSWVSASSAAYTDGYVMTRQTGAFTFPIGDNNKYRPAAVSASSAAAPASAAYFAIDGTLAVTSSLKGGNEPVLPTGGPFPTATKATNVGIVDNVEYWDIDGTTPAKITLTWDANTPISTMVGSNLNNLTIVGWDGTKWVAIPSTVDASSLNLSTSASVFNGSSSSLTVGSITTNATLVPSSFTVYTLAGACLTTSITPDLTSLSICSGDQAAITYTTIPAGAQVVWSRNPGTGSNLGNVIDFPTATGTTPVSYTYTASITPYVGCPTATTTTVVTVNPVPILTPSVCSQTICSGQTGAITFNSSVPATINWLRVEDNTTGTGNISQLFNTAGTYTYKIWGVSSSASCPSSTTITCTIVVNNCCDLVASASPVSATNCSPVNSGSMLITYTGTGSYQYSLNGAAAQPLGTSPFTVSGLAPGSYTLVVQQIGDPTCLQTIVATIGGPPALSASALSNSPQCTSGTLSLSALPGSSGTYTYAWTGPNGFVSSLQYPTLPLSTTAQSGIYQVVVTNAGSGCSATATTSVVVTVQPSLTVSGGTSQTICSGQSTTLSVGGAGGANVSWINSVGQSGTGSNIVFPGIGNLNGSPQTITYVITASAGACSDSKTVTLTINPAPVLKVVPQQLVVCALEQSSVTAMALPATATINWSRSPATPGPASGTGTGSVTVRETLPAGSYTYTFTASQGGCAGTPVTTQLTVNN